MTRQAMAGAALAAVAAQMFATTPPVYRYGSRLADDAETPTSAIQSAARGLSAIDVRRMEAAEAKRLRRAAKRVANQK